MAEPITEHFEDIIDRKIGYCRYGHGPQNFLFICGGVGKHLLKLLTLNQI